MTLRTRIADRALETLGDLYCRAKAEPYADVDHITKLDPDKQVTFTDVETMLEAGTDAIMIGGSTGVTPEKTGETFDTVEDANSSYGVPVFFEPGGIEDFGNDPARQAETLVDLVGRADYLAKDSVRNSRDPEAITLSQNEANRYLRQHIRDDPATFIRDRLGARLPDPAVDFLVEHGSRQALRQLATRGADAKMISQHYIVLNPDCDAARVTDAINLGERYGPAAEDIATAVGGIVWNSIQDGPPDAIYIEYSGTLGDPGVVEAARSAIEDVRADVALLYGGGIHDAESARRMAQYADTIVVGNRAHEDPTAARATVV